MSSDASRIFHRAIYLKGLKVMMLYRLWFIIPQFDLINEFETIDEFEIIFYNNILK